MLHGPLPVPNLVFRNFIPVLSVSPDHCMALGRFIPSLSLYFPICVLEPWGQVIPRRPLGSDFPWLHLRQVQLPGFPASQPSALLCPVSGFLHWLDSPPRSTSPINTSGLFCKHLQEGKRAIAPVHPQFIQADPPSRGSLVTVVLVNQNPSALEV